MTNDPNVVQVNDSSFDKEVLGSELPVLVDFVATWCAPCKAMAPTIAKLAAETAGRVKVVTVDTEESPQTAIKYGIRAVPTLLVFRNGDQTIRQLGAVSKERLLELVRL